MLRSSEYVQLGSETFLDEFGVLWDEHINFGTSRSHKKQLQRDQDQEMEWRVRAEAKAQEAAAAGGDGHASARKPKKKRKRADTDGGVHAKVLTGSAPGSTKATQSMLPNKGRFSGTLAAQLLG